MPIELYVGQQGAGKTYCMVKEAILPCLRKKEWIVLSNMDVTEHDTGRKTIDLTDATGELDFNFIAQVVDTNLARPAESRRPILLAVDEVGRSMPQEIWRDKRGMDTIALILQLRKSRIDFVGTVQQFERAVKVLRDNTNVVHICSVFWRTPLLWRRDKQGVIDRRTGHYYRYPWLFEVETLTPNAINAAEDSVSRKRARKGYGYRKVRFSLKTAAAFDTYQRISLTAAAKAPASDNPTHIAELLDDVDVNELIDQRLATLEPSN